MPLVCVLFFVVSLCRDLGFYAGILPFPPEIYAGIFDFDLERSKPGRINTLKRTLSETKQRRSKPGFEAPDLRSV